MSLLLYFPSPAQWRRGNTEPFWCGPAVQMGLSHHTLLPLMADFLHLAIQELTQKCHTKCARDFDVPMVYFCPAEHAPRATSALLRYTLGCTAIPAYLNLLDYLLMDICLGNPSLSRDQILESHNAILIPNFRIITAPARKQRYLYVSSFRHTDSQCLVWEKSGKSY